MKASLVSTPLTPAVNRGACLLIATCQRKPLETLKMTARLLLILILSSLAVLFIAQNVVVVEIGFLYWRASMSSALPIFFSLMTGFALGWVMHSYRMHRKAMSTKGELQYVP